MYKNNEIFVYMFLKKCIFCLVTSSSDSAHELALQNIHRTMLTKLNVHESTLHSAHITMSKKFMN